MKAGCPYGTHRVLNAKHGKFPQAASKLDNHMEIYDNELLIDVEMLNIDAASFRQIREEANDDKEKMAETILKIVNSRGKMHNPVTDSGGVLMGTVKQVGENFTKNIKPGEKIVTLVSLSLTPLKIEKIYDVIPEKEQVLISGQAILFQSGIYAKLTEDLSLDFVLSVLDVAGAPAQTRKITKEGDTVFIIGSGGKSGMLCLCAARKQVGSAGKVIGLAYSAADYQRTVASGLANHVIQGDARNPLEILEKVKAVTQNRLADVSINCANVGGTEMASIITTKEGGTVYFFNMATKFTAAALGAEGIGKDVNLLIGNGYTKGHVEVALGLANELRKKGLF
ncbi:L-erythro-3,5-diaminohexanoate dehydrogenase [Neobacillus rhizosphaerae]|uniref:L-erythro-3,5-diaminohexanoate dehydrogenase n=2 Tax=Neobacillus rhizosphaerae TaxID=2880965 RepID=A0ABM9EV79_9BACI|nr:L-erythro-3,5-diaminohexanoate dehydrogenase [Neobacillus rhizosphaerae]CAH2716564.1 L-erythro-3,5-diaminohexanoate dehydrogenase [Neobacillus rhizosphaerae]